MEFYFLSQYRNLCGLLRLSAGLQRSQQSRARRVLPPRAAGLVPGEEKARFYSASCNHCERPMCVAACPNGAFYKEADGTVRHDDGKCSGCGKCLWACPYGSISLSKERGVAQKCTGCYDRRQQGLDPRAWLRASTGACNGARPTAGATRRRFTAGCPRFFPSPGRRGPGRRSTARFCRERSRTMTACDYLILGGGRAGLCAAEAIRKNDKTGSITMISDEGRSCRIPGRC